MPNLARTIEGLDWQAISTMGANELRGVLLMLQFQAMDELARKRQLAQIGAIKRRYKYRK